VTFQVPTTQNLLTFGKSRVKVFTYIDYRLCCGPGFGNVRQLGPDLDHESAADSGPGPGLDTIENTQLIFTKKENSANSDKILLYTINNYIKLNSLKFT